MTNKEIENKIINIHNELDVLLADGSKEAIMKSIALLENTGQVFFRKDDGIRNTYLFQKIWMDEMVRKESSIFNGINCIDDVLNKSQLIRHAFFRLENNFPVDMCIEAIQVISDHNLSNTAFREILTREIEDGEKVIARIGELSQV